MPGKTYVGRVGAMLVIWLLCPLAHIVSSVWMLFGIFGRSNRAWRIAVAYDRVGNAATGGADTETISSRAARARDNNRKWGCVLCKLLDYFEEDHCNKNRGV